MALNGRGGSPTHNSAGATVKNTKLKPTGGSIAKNNTDFRKGAYPKDPSMPMKSNGEVLTNPWFDKLRNTGRPATTATTKKKLPSGMTQKTAKQLPLPVNKYGQPNTQVNIARGSSYNGNVTMKNLSSYMKRKAQGKVR